MSVGKVTMAPLGSGSRDGWSASCDPAVPCVTWGPRVRRTPGRGRSDTPWLWGGSGLGAGAGRADLSRGRERHALLDGLDLFDVGETVLGQPAEDAVHQFFGDRGSAGHADRGHVVQPALVDLGGVVDQVGGGRTVVLGHLDP